MSKEEFLKDQDLKDIGAYRLLVAMEAALGLCFHIAAKHLKRVPEDYADCFAILGEAGLLPRNYQRSYKRWPVFRNLLVHMYWKVDYQVLDETIQKDLEDLRQFSKAIAGLL
ncbi:MAG: DUF86 domain-containing protein [Desulfobacterota bacterium]|nr:DUF86 domain-containing protein [Thermodesulfobacteriota bacterium]